MKLFETITKSEEDTKKVAFEFASITKKGDIVVLSGDLGSGKTTFVKGFCLYFNISEEDVSSPSFTLLNVYEGRVRIYHLDLYRIENINFVDYETFLDYLKDEKAIKLIEWNKINIDLEFDLFVIEIEHISEKERKITIKKG
ncbi:MAG: tRNA (adenosine(37)-N6)-threonylcarbamoyltransferase complex ATPase subunit type 1 TsaE [Brevinematales bacterium]|nr:tRNA (adenosine(37)-N6)-threonylcarbamoyltransferase complex ATPase subunit type 1 TsaE [Brevinematales bacterium]